MSYEDLQQVIWLQLTPLKWLAGREACNRILRRCVRTLPVGMTASNLAEQNRLMKHAAAAIVRRERNVTMGILLTIFLSALVSEILKALLAWWKARPENQILFRGYQQEQSDG